MFDRVFGKACLIYQRVFHNVCLIERFSEEVLRRMLQRK
jgi:hypothetical protein